MSSEVLELSLSSICLLCTNEVLKVQVEDLNLSGQKTPNPDPNPGSSSSSCGSAAKLISHEQCTFVLFRHVLGRDLPPSICNDNQIKLCKNDSKIKYCNSCLTQITIIHDLVAQLARVERELEEQKAKIALQFCSTSQVDPPSNSAAPEAARLPVPENERQEFMELRNAIFGGLKLLKPRSILAVVQNLKNRKGMRNRPTLPSAPAHAQPSHFPTRFGSSSNSSSVRLMKNVSIPRLKLQTRSAAAAEPAVNAERMRLVTMTTSTATMTTTSSAQSAQANALLDLQSLALEILADPLADNDATLQNASEADRRDRDREPLTSSPRAIGVGVAYFCGVCSTYFQDHDSLTQHDDKVHRRRRRRCRDDAAATAKVSCSGGAKVGVKCSSGQGQRRRVGTVAKKFKCPQCPARFAQKSHWNDHQLVHSGEKPFQCPICFVTFQKKSNLRRHSKNLHPPPPKGQGQGQDPKMVEPTPTITKTTTLGPEPSIGAQPIQQIRGFEPEPSASGMVILEEKIFSAASDFCVGAGGAQAHAQQVEGAELEGSPDPTRTVQIPPALLQMAYLCGVCGAIFKDRDSLNQHGDEHEGHHGDADAGNLAGPSSIPSPAAAAPAIVLPTPTPTSPLSRGHPAQPKVCARSTPNQKKYKCKLCPTKFAAKSSVKRHLAVVHRTGEKAFKCPTCPKSFALQSYLQMHTKLSCPGVKGGVGVKGRSSGPQQRREASKKFKCPQCPVKFAAQSSVARHLLRIHAPAHAHSHSARAAEKRFQCHLCPAKVGSEWHLRRHLLVHKRFQCPLCPAKFAKKWNLDDHELVHSGEKPFQCLTCLKAFQKKSNLRRHSENVHGDRPKGQGQGQDKKMTGSTTTTATASLEPPSSIGAQPIQQIRRSEPEPEPSSSASGMVTLEEKLFSDASDFCVGARGTQAQAHAQQVEGAELEESPDPTVLQIPTALLQMAYLCGVCGAIFKDRNSLNQHGDEGHEGQGHRHRDQDDDDARNLLGASPGASIHSSAVGLEPTAKPTPQRGQGHRGHPHKTVPALGRRRSQKNIKCTLCPAKFVYNSGLKEHLAVHTGERRFQCPSCSKSFKRNTHLRRHFASFHSKGQRQRQGQNIQNLVEPGAGPEPGISSGNARLAQAPKKHKCTLCPAKFAYSSASSSALRRHLVVHSEIRPFECPSCPKSFKRNSHLRLHSVRFHLRAQGQGQGQGVVQNLVLEPDRDPSSSTTESCGGGTLILEEKIVPDLYLHDQDEGQGQGQTWPSKSDGGRGGVGIDEIEGLASTSTKPSQVPQGILSAGEFVCGTCGAANFEDFDSLEKHGKIHAADNWIASGQGSGRGHDGCS